LPTEVVPIFQAVLPNGKVLMWDSVGDGPAESYTDHTFTRAMVWDPVTNTSVRRDVVGYNIFCAGYAQLADGRVLVAGGNRDSALSGIVQTHIFDWRSETWTRGPDMASGRWYPSVAALGNDEAVIVGGGPAVPEVYQTNGALRRLTSASGYSDRSYPFLVPRPDGKVELVGPHSSMNTIDTSGTGAITAALSRDGIERDYGSFATYDIGKVLVSGGGNLTEGGQSNVPTKTAVVVDVNTGTSVRATASMSVGRRQHNLTVLADGTVLATGGQSRSVDGLVDLNYPVFAAERWNPAAGTWTVLSSASRVRQYHSSATLLPDGRVLTGGGGICGTCASKGYLEKNVEYFEPPYLFKTDGSGQRAARPVIDSAPATAGYGQGLAIASAQAATIGKVGLVRLGAPTHSEDQGQRYVPLSFSASGTTITATSPASSNIAPAGYYMLFVTDTAGVPSVAKMIKLVNPPPSGGSRITGIGGRCLDIKGGAAVNRVDLWMNTCNGSASQNWLYSTTDKSLRSLGKCMEIAGNTRKAGARVQLNTCNATAAQTWERREIDRTIRSSASPSLCLQPKAGSTALQAKVEVATCTTGAVAQQWTW
jgi:hypothetical protein